MRDPGKRRKLLRRFFYRRLSCGSPTSGRSGASVGRPIRIPAPVGRGVGRYQGANRPESRIDFREYFYVSGPLNGVISRPARARLFIT